ncbi:MAG TPA: triose-phosphate isomerase, partial [Fimbriimonas sp.]|nr:triose-phosphate isomerase [Fimbriimonas sp.]
MRTPIIVGNWKMNKTLSEATTTLSALHESTGDVSGVEFGICAPFPYLAALAMQGTVSVGAQDVFWADAGAFTGFTSGAMLSDIGCKYAIIGHSERRGRFGKLEVPESTIPFFAETEETVNLKLKAAIKYGLVPIVCVGETLAEREAGNTDSVIQSQMAGALAGLEADDLATLVIAYEPVWAIGTGKVCDAEEA